MQNKEYILTAFDDVQSQIRSLSLTIGSLAEHANTPQKKKAIAQAQKKLLNYEAIDIKVLKERMLK